jgi:AcrR family transcriptional regulator
MKLFTRYRILNATRAIVAELGVERVTMRGIAKLANITAPAIYKHFKNKKELLEEVVAHGYVEMADEMLQRTKKSGGGVRVMVDAGRAYAERYPRLFQMMAAPLSNDEMAISVWSQMRGFLARRPEGNLRERYDASMELLLRPIERPRLSAA